MLAVAPHTYVLFFGENYCIVTNSSGKMLHLGFGGILLTSVTISVAISPCLIKFLSQNYTSNCVRFEDAGNILNYQIMLLDEATETNQTVPNNNILNYNRPCESLLPLADVSFVTHLSVDRHYMIEQLARRWNGPMTFAIFYPKKSLFKPFFKFVKRSRDLRSRTNIQYFAVFRKDNKQSEVYPTNILRNVAFRASLTKYVLLLDVDFVPNVRIYESLVRQMRQYDQSHRLSVRRSKTAFVIPAFEPTSNNTMETLHHLPQNKADFLKSWLKYNKYRVFNGNTFKGGQKPTNALRWARSARPYDINWKPGYEPYIVAGACQLPLFDERFVDRWDNKITYFYKLASEKFRFVVLPHDFVIHVPHLKTWKIHQHQNLNDCLCFGKAEKEFFNEIGYCLQLSNSSCKTSWTNEGSSIRSHPIQDKISTILANNSLP